MAKEPATTDVASDLPEQVRIRSEKRIRLMEAGRDPYPAELPVTSTIAQVREEFPNLEPGEETDDIVGLVGRVVLSRNTGKLCFATLQDGEGRQIQAMLSAAEVGADSLADYKADVDLGDFLFIHGRVISSRRGELSIMATAAADVPAWALASKSIRPLPKVFQTEDGETVELAEDTRVRRRWRPWWRGRGGR